VFSISVNEADLIKNAGVILNTLLERKAREFRWHFEDVAPDFAGHGYCRRDAEGMWIRAASPHSGESSPPWTPTSPRTGPPT
jgi:hypothetical protein